MSLLCPQCGRHTEQVHRAGNAGLYFRCVVCCEVFILTGNVLVSAVPPELDVDYTRWEPLWK